MIPFVMENYIYFNFTTVIMITIECPLIFGYINLNSGVKYIKVQGSTICNQG